MGNILPADMWTLWIWQSTLMWFWPCIMV